MPSLADLDARFLRITNEDSYERVDSLADAQGVLFLCPLCYAKNGGNVGTHSVICWFWGKGVPDDLSPGPGRWTPAGSGLDDLTFSGPRSASVQLSSGCRWHGFVKNGQAS